MTYRTIKRIIGTGGIGTGNFFLFDSNTTLGRNESRLAYLSNAKDYCKCHIVFSYLSMLLPKDIDKIPIGKVGRDANGENLLGLMRKVGLNTDFVTYSDNSPTMYSACFQYPDKEGGNITTKNSACNEVTEEYIESTMNKLTLDENTMVVALPEVPVKSRVRMLEIAKKKKALCVASNASDEMEEFVLLGGMNYCDWLAMNEDELSKLAHFERINGFKDIEKAADEILKTYPKLLLYITYGANGGMIASSEKKVILKPLEGITVANTGGAGDAALAGLIIGYIRELPIFEEDGAGALGMKLAGLSVESEDSINFDAVV